MSQNPLFQSLAYYRDRLSHRCGSVKSARQPTFFVQNGEK